MTINIIPMVGTNEQDQSRQNLAIQATARAVQGNAREKLSAARGYYVATTGSNTANDGLSAGSPFLTLQKAFTVISQTIDIGGQTVTINVADGTYTAGINFSAGTTGGGNLIVSGNLTTPANVIISVTSDNAFVNSGTITSTVTLRGMKIQTTTVGRCIDLEGIGNFIINTLDFGACAGEQILVGTGAFLRVNGAYTISGNALNHLACLNGGVFQLIGRTVTLTGTPAFGGFVRADRLSFIDWESAPPSGAATGSRYSVDGNSLILTGGGGANYFPGNSVGTEVNGGRYL